MKPETIKRRRLDAHMTQKQAAERVFVSERCWRYWENGERIPTAQSVALIRTRIRPTEGKYARRNPIAPGGRAE